MSEDPLDKLIVEKDANEVSLELLAGTLHHFVRFTTEGEMIFEPKFFDLPEWKKTVIYLLSRKVISIKKFIAGFQEGATPKEISDVTGVPAKNVSRDLATKLKMVARNLNGKYMVPNYNIHKCAELLK